MVAPIRHVKILCCGLAMLAGLGAFSPVFSPFGVAFAANSKIVGRASATDGDSLEISGVRIRMIGIDAPEFSQVCMKDHKKYRCGLESTRALSTKIKDKVVTCLSSGKDKYGRILGQCFVDDEDVNRWMVREGHAIAYRRYGSQYNQEEDAAKAEKKGIWAGYFKPPEKYRHKR